MKISVEDLGNALFIRIEGSLSVEDLKDFQDAMNSYLLQEKHIILDMTEVSFIDSSSLGIIVLFYSKLLQIKKELIITNIKPEIYQMFNLTGVSKRMRLFKTNKEALDFIKEL